MFIYTAVASLAPLDSGSTITGGRGKKGAAALPPDLLSGGRREILASYTALTFSGNFQDVARRLIDALPQPTQERKSDSKTAACGEVTRYECGRYYFNQLVCREGLVFLCMDDSAADGGRVFDYLKCISTAVLAAVQQHSATAAPRSLDTLKRAVSLALVDSLNRWMSSSSSNFSSVQPATAGTSPVRTGPVTSSTSTATSSNTSSASLRDSMSRRNPSVRLVRATPGSSGCAATAALVEAVHEVNHSLLQNYNHSSSSTSSSSAAANGTGSSISSSSTSSSSSSRRPVSTSHGERPQPPRSLPPTPFPAPLTSGGGSLRHTSSTGNMYSLEDAPWALRGGGGQDNRGSINSSSYATQSERNLHHSYLHTTAASTAAAASDSTQPHTVLTASGRWLPPPPSEPAPTPAAMHAVVNNGSSSSSAAAGSSSSSGSGGMIRSGSQQQHMAMMMQGYSPPPPLQSLQQQQQPQYSHQYSHHTQQSQQQQQQQHSSHSSPSYRTGSNASAGSNSGTQQQQQQLQQQQYYASSTGATAGGNSSTGPGSASDSPPSPLYDFSSGSSAYSHFSSAPAGGGSMVIDPSLAFFSSLALNGPGERAPRPPANPSPGGIPGGTIPPRPLSGDARQLMQELYSQQQAHYAAQQYGQQHGQQQHHQQQQRPQTVAEERLRRRREQAGAASTSKRLDDRPVSPSIGVNSSMLDSSGGSSYSSSVYSSTPGGSLPLTAASAAAVTAAAVAAAQQSPRRRTTIAATLKDCTDPVRRRDVGILLPMDYSGMVDGLFEGNTLLNEVDGMVRNAIKCQVSVSTTMEDMLTILVEFRETLGAMTLPRPTTVDYRQALTDAQREAIRVNGSLKHNGDTEELLASLRTLVAPLVFDEALTDQVCQDIIRASSRTASGGDTYSAMTSLLAMPEAGYLLTPNGEESLPIDINVDATKGEVVITVENSFLLRRGDPMDSGINSSSGSLAKTFRARLEKAKLRMDPLKVMGGARKNKDKDESEDLGDCLPLNGRLEVYLSLPDGACKRRLGITCPIVEAVPQQCIALGAGTPAANGTFDLAGWRNGAPLYINNTSSVTITKAELSGRSGWARPVSPKSKERGRSRSRSRSFSNLVRSKSRSRIDLDAIAAEAAAQEEESSGSLKRMFSFTSHKKGPSSSSGLADAAHHSNGDSSSSTVPHSPPQSPSARSAAAAAAAGGSKPALVKQHSFARSAAAVLHRRAAPAPAPAKKGLLSRYKSERLPYIVGNLLAVALVALAVGLYYAPAGGARLMRRDAPLVEGDSLKAGEYINTCTGVLAPVMKCKPMYFEMATDGELGLYKGSGPKDNQGKLWGSNTRTKTTTSSSSSSSSSSKSSSKSNNSKKSAPAAQREAPPVASYSDGKLAVLRGDKVLWKYPRNRLPKEYFKGDWPLKA